jgi:tetratricopeptide (TPR) repeat protein
VLSWWEARWDGRRLGERNLVLHEFAHQVEQYLAPADRGPPWSDAAWLRRWEEVTAAESDRLAEDADYDRPTLLDPYGATNEREFFAVATETFFLQPQALRREHPDLYEMLSGWYAQDPATRWRFENVPSSEAAEAEREYEEHVLAECSAALRHKPDNAEVYRVRADTYLALGDLDRALADCDAVVRLAPDDPEAYCQRAGVYGIREQYDHAVADYTRAIDLAPDYAAAYGQRGALHALTGDLDQALADLKQAIRLDPRDDLAYLERARVYLQRRKLDKALRDVTKAIQLCPRTADAFVLRARIYLKTGEPKRAWEDCEQALALDPEDEEAGRLKRKLES